MVYYIYELTRCVLVKEGKRVTNVTKYRKLKGMTQADLCRATGISPQLLSMIENGTRNLTIESAKMIAPVLGVKWYELYDK